MLMIGMTGRRRSGKDTFAEVLRVEGGFAHKSFAAPLKVELCKWLGVDICDLERNKEDYRSSLIARGMHMRQIKPGYWIEKARATLGSWTPSRIVFSDVRFEDEAAWIREQCGIIVRMVRIWPDIPSLVTGIDDHESETNADMIKADVTVYCASADEVRLSASLLARALDRVQA